MSLVLLWSVLILSMEAEAVDRSQGESRCGFQFPWLSSIDSENESHSVLTLCDPIDYTVHGIFQARILEWVAFPFSRGSSQPRD